MVPEQKSIFKKSKGWREDDSILLMFKLKPDCITALMPFW
jgi:hypothetical protein